MPRASPPPVPAYVSAFSSQWPRQTEGPQIHHHTVGFKPFVGKCKLTSATKTLSSSDSFRKSDKSMIKPPHGGLTVNSATPSISIPRSTGTVGNGAAIEREIVEKGPSIPGSPCVSNVCSLESFDIAAPAKIRQKVSSSPFPSFACPSSFSSWKVSMYAVQQATPSRNSPQDSSLSRFGSSAKSAATWESFKTRASWGAQRFSEKFSYDNTQQDDLVSINGGDGENLSGSDSEAEDVFSMDMDDVTDGGPDSFLAKLAKAVSDSPASPPSFVTSVLPSRTMLRQRKRPSSPRKPEPSSFYFGKKATDRVAVNAHPSGLAVSEAELFAEAKRKYEIFRQPRVIQAWNVAVDAHRGQFRRNGDACSVHCLQTGLILAELGLDENLIIAAILQHTLDGTHLNAHFLQTEFGFDIANLVSQVSKLSRINELMRTRTSPMSSEELDSLNKMLLAMITDIRVVMIKMADRLHNLRTIHALPHAKPQRMARDSLDIYIPLANRLGIWQMKAELEALLEDVCFEILHPEAHRKIRDGLEDNTATAAHLSAALNTLHTALESREIPSELYGRTKSLYSIFKKMKKKQRRLNEIFDVRGMRVIVDTVDECYQVLEQVHQLWKPIHGELKDYIQHPKLNNYQSLHTAVMAENGCPLEVQIRTKEMHQLAEYGIAAHWKYKEQRSDKSRFVDEKIHWLRSMLEWRHRVMASASAPEPDALPSMISYPKQHTVVVATHTGELLELPVGSSLRDAAAAIDSSRPAQLWSVKVNDCAVHPMYHLRDGDLVQLIPCLLQTNLVHVQIPESPSTCLSLPVLVDARL